MLNGVEKTYGPRTIFSERLHAEKYRAPGESFRESAGRIASTLSDGDSHYRELREILLDMRFLPGGRIQAAIGTLKTATAYNCFVGGVIPDSFVARDNPENSSIMHRAEQAAATMRMGGGLGNDFSTLRPNGSLIKKLSSVSQGPLKFMPIFDAVGKATSSTGNRRGAQMGVLRIDHPDIWEFVHFKQNEDVLNGFNISVAVTDEFMEHLDADRPFPLRFGGEVYRTVEPRALWEAIMRSTWDWAEPGVLFIDTINRMNNLWYCETLAATNPCGEQPLPPFGACLLGSFNLVKYLTLQSDGRFVKFDFDYDYLRSDIPAVVRAMDNVVDRTTYPLPEQKQEALNKRRMGIGVTGLANALEACGHPYGSLGFAEMESRILHLINRECYLAGAELAFEKGSFPLYDPDKFLRSRFVATLDDDVTEFIRYSGLRNSHYTSVAPTGTISMAADNISSAIEPVYRYAQERDVIMLDGKRKVDLYDYGFANLHVRGRRASMGEVHPEEHLRVLTTAQNHVDSAVSKTINTDGTVPWDDFQGIYFDGYHAGAKGCTTFNKDGKRAGLFKEVFEAADLPFPDDDDTVLVSSVPEAASCEFDPATGRRSCE